MSFSTSKRHAPEHLDPTYTEKREYRETLPLERDPPLYRFTYTMMAPWIFSHSSLSHF